MKKDSGAHITGLKSSPVRRRAAPGRAGGQCFKRWDQGVPRFNTRRGDRLSEVSRLTVLVLILQWGRLLPFLDPVGLLTSKKLQTNESSKSRRLLEDT